jgi:hypothetical protein
VETTLAGPDHSPGGPPGVVFKVLGPDNGRCDDVEAVVGPLADGLVDKGVHRARRLDQARDGGAPDDQERHYLNEYFPWHSECSIGTRRTTTAVVPAETRNDGDALFTPGRRERQNTHD